MWIASWARSQRSTPAERQRVLRSSIQRRVQLVRDVLGGASIDSVELGYRLEQEHLAVVATGPAADASLRDLARRLERRLRVFRPGHSFFKILRQKLSWGERKA